MNAYSPTSLASKLAIAAVTLVVGWGSLELVANGMSHPEPAALAARAQFIAMEAASAQEIRDLARGEVRYAANSVASR